MKKISISIFLIFIFGMSLINLITPDLEYSENENKTLVQLPEFSLQSLLSGDFATDFETYISDQFSFRDMFISLKTEAELTTGKSENNGVYIGKNGYLLQIIDNINQEQVDKNISYLQTFAQKNPNAKIMIIPTATAVLTQNLPNFANPYDQSELLDTIKNAVGEDNFIDTLQLLQSHKDEYIYYKTDHHYTALGAFYVANAYKDAVGLEQNLLEDYDITDVSTDFFGTLYSKSPIASLTADTITKFDDNKNYTVEYNMGQDIKDSLYQEEFLETKDQYSYYLGGNNPLVKITTENKNGKKLLVIKDSYAHSFAPFVLDDYEEVHLLDLRYINFSVAGYMESNEITDTLILYNTQGFLSDTSLYKLLG